MQIDVKPIFEKMYVPKPKVTAESTEKALANDGSTFNEAGQTFNEAGKAFNGVYGGDGIAPIWII